MDLLIGLLFLPLIVAAIALLFYLLFLIVKHPLVWVRRRRERRRLVRARHERAARLAVIRELTDDQITAIAEAYAEQVTSAVRELPPVSLPIRERKVSA